MKHLSILLMLSLLTAVLPTAKAQSLINTHWKAYIGDPVNDSLVLHIKTDSSYVTDRNGTAVVRSVCKISADTLSLTDYDGEYACPSMTGRYKVAQSGGMLIFTLIDDPCDGRAAALPLTKWRKVPDAGSK
ncbi:MAG TPA: hypothetical protein VKQ52_08800 [Puia sp.]|nr:hypothetical protein [Puia sp.]